MDSQSNFYRSYQKYSINGATLYTLYKFTNTSINTSSQLLPQNTQ